MALTIFHIMRSPVGGLFRHVVDLARFQSASGHRVGIVADASTGGARADSVLAELDGELALGVSRVAMPRNLASGDVTAWKHVRNRVSAQPVDIVHGHGSKGGAYARLIRHPGITVYTPHGGSLHYAKSSPVGLAYLTLERILALRTDLFLFESAYAKRTFTQKVGEPKGLVRVVHNGVGPEEFLPVGKNEDATDLLFIGELRHLKGVDVLIDAIQLLKVSGRRMTATIVGAGPDGEAFREQARSLGLSDVIRFPGAMPAREAFAHGRVLVVPSRAESLPYIILEAGAAGLPVIATNVGGIGEIFGADSASLIPASDPPALVRAIIRTVDQASQTAQVTARLQERIGDEFSIGSLGNGVISAYQAAMTMQRTAVNG